MHPHEMLTEQQDLVFGKPETGPTIVEVLGLHRNLHHDRVTIDALNGEGRRVQLALTQEALRTLTELTRRDVDGPDRPRVS